MRLYKGVMAIIYGTAVIAMADKSYNPRAITKFFIL